MKAAVIVKTALLVLLIAAWVTGCGGVRLGYGQSERLMKWYVNSYVDFDGPQDRALAQELADLKLWHCRTQLRDYSAWLQSLRDEIAPSLAVAQVRARSEDVHRFMTALANDIVPRATRLAANMTDAQVEELEKSFAKDNAKYRQRWVDVDPEQYREARAGRMSSRLKWWIGALTDEQKNIVRIWTNSAEVYRDAALDSRLRWQQALLAALQNRSDHAQLEEKIRVLITAPETHWTDAMQQKFAVNRDLTYALFADIALVMTPAQQQHIDRKLESLITDFEKLSCPQQRASAQP